MELYKLLRLVSFTQHVFRSIHVVACINNSFIFIAESPDPVLFVLFAYKIFKCVESEVLFSLHIYSARSLEEGKNGNTVVKWWSLGNFIQFDNEQFGKSCKKLFALLEKPFKQRFRRFLLLSLGSLNEWDYTIKLYFLRVRQLNFDMFLLKTLLSDL